ncbi:UNVERIFIED_CONTAM: hypothetical protein Sradi_6948300 [Sesamum radiatum]|uniref:Uncharacterized protein n=1 Tax=Sesamum radiatum TaxID=300843 RepID=A0AAW2JFW9_SESRA
MCAELPQVRRRSRQVRPFWCARCHLCAESGGCRATFSCEFENLPTGEYEQNVEVPRAKTAQVHMRCKQQAILGVARSGR